MTDITEELLAMERMFNAQSCEEPAFGDTYRIHFGAEQLGENAEVCANARATIERLRSDLEASKEVLRAVATVDMDARQMRNSAIAIVNG